MADLWTPEIEENFFWTAFKEGATPEELFYRTVDNRYLAYWPKGYTGKKSTMQSRNSHIGKFTETWSRKLLEDCVKTENLSVIQGAVCEQIGLTKKSAGDVIIVKQHKTPLVPEDILVIFEVKMSVMWNWEFKSNDIKRLGDYETHQGTPGLLRSDSMLKAIGKAINIKVSNRRGSSIPIIVLGNAPITDSYRDKVDHLKASGIIQGFWSVNPKPLEAGDTLKATTKKGFVRFDTYESFRQALVQLLSIDTHFFSSMKSMNELGRIIEKANREPSYERKAEAFLKFLEL